MTSIMDALSDVDLERRVRNYLTTRGLSVGEVPEVSVNQGIVTLRGAIASESTRWLATSCGRRVAGVVTLIDELHVTPQSQVSLQSVARNCPSWMLDYLRNASSPQEFGHDYNPDRKSPPARGHL